MDAQPSLEERIASVLRDDNVDAEQAAELIEEVRAAAADTSERAQVLRRYALCPSLSEAEALKARQQMEAAAFRHERLQAAAQRLGKRVQELRNNAENQRRRTDYERVKAERDELAQELAAVYPEAVARISEVAARIAVNDQQIEAINRGGRPSGYPALLSAELVARGFESFTYNSMTTPRITHDLRMPHWEWALDYAYPPLRR